VTDHGKPNGMRGKGRDVSVAFPPGRGERGQSVDEVAMPVAPSGAEIRHESSPRNFQGVRLNLVITGRKDRVTATNPRWPHHPQRTC